jgi:putative phosphoribosyl transferase
MGHGGAWTATAKARRIVCVIAPEHLWAIGFWYLEFGQTSDREVVELLRPAAA